MYDYTRICAHVHRQSLIFFGGKLREFGINAGQFPPLMCICDHPGFTQDQIADEVRIDKSTVAKVIKQLIESGFVRREENPADKRSYFVFPTEKARETYPKIAEEKRRWHESLLENLTEAEREVLRMLFEKLKI